MATINGTAGDDTLNGTSGDDTIFGFEGNDTINGGAGNDILNGGTGADIIDAGEGDDQIELDAAAEAPTGEQIIGGGGTDTLVASVPIGTPDGQKRVSIAGVTLTGIEALETLNDAVMGVTAAQIAAVTTISGNFYFESAGAISVSGASELGRFPAFYLNQAGNQLDLSGFAGGFAMVLGSDSSDTVNGSSGAENLYGFGGDDELHGGGGVDAVQGWDGNDVLDGGAGDDSVEGGNGSDYLDGGAGRDDMYGGVGDDLYVVDHVFDWASESADQGIDTVLASVTLGSMLDDNVENLTLTGSDAIDGRGNSLDNVLTGNNAANLLFGGDGDDTLYGNGGADELLGDGGNDEMHGGLGNDLYAVDSAEDAVIENAGEGTDTVYTSITYVLPDNCENLSVLAANVTAIGNALENVITGNNVTGLVLRGMAGNDQLIGFAYDDRLDGGADVDSMSGAEGDDVYVVDSYSDKTIENAGEGSDSVLSSASFKLSANVENLTLTGTADLWAYGNELANTLTGNGGANKLYGLAGNDTLKGGAGVDTMFGGLGNDVYYADSYSDKAIEDAGEGTDSVLASASFKLGGNVEKLTLTGTADLYGYGNELANTLTGNSGANKLYGLAGNDTLTGGAGGDWLEGGAGLDKLFGGDGNDSFVFRDGDFAGLNTWSCDQVKDFTEGTGDKIRLNLVDANTGLAGDQAFAFVGTAAFSNVAGELRYEQISGNTYVSGDTNGDGIADFMIRVDGLHTLVGTDFGL